MSFQVFRSACDAHGVDIGLAYERLIEWIYRRIVVSEDQVIDIGASWGLHTWILADLVGGNGRVHAIEPNPEIFKQIAANATKSQLSSVIFYELGVSGCAENFGILRRSRHGWIQ